jgi:LysM repeat protein
MKENQRRFVQQVLIFKSLLILVTVLEFPTPPGKCKLAVHRRHMEAFLFNHLAEVDMKTLLAAVACIPLLVACNNRDDATTATTSTTAPVAAAPADTTTTSPVATQTAETAPVTATMPDSVSGTSGTSDTGSSGSSGSSGASGSSGSSGSSAAGATAASGDGTYVVDKGDTLWSIAQKNGISHGNLATWNNIDDPRELQIGRKLTLTAP